MKLWKAVTALAFGSVVVWCALAGPVLLRNSSGPFLRDRLVVLNPIRSRAPERLARQLITEIHSPHCGQALAEASAFQGKRETICAKQAADPLRTTCNLTDRVDFRDQVGISFQCGYERGAPDGAFVTLTFLNRDQRPILQNYERIY